MHAKECAWTLNEYTIGTLNLPLNCIKRPTILLKLKLIDE